MDGMWGVIEREIQGFDLNNQEDGVVVKQTGVPVVKEFEWARSDCLHCLVF